MCSGMRSTSGLSQPCLLRPGNESAVFRADMQRIPMALGSSEGLRLHRLGSSSSPKTAPQCGPGGWGSPWKEHRAGVQPAAQGSDLGSPTVRSYVQ